MPLTPGTRLGPYEVTAKIGVGGMGEVYRARDGKLSRDVALKILPEAFVDDVDRVARFNREAQVLASLNHPNIAHVYGFEDADEAKALVMELVEGPTLADQNGWCGVAAPRLAIWLGMPVGGNDSTSTPAVFGSNDWSRDGKELFYLPGPNEFAVVRVAIQPAFSVSKAEALTRGVFLEGGPDALRNIDVLPDGRFVGVVDLESESVITSPRINVILNWFEELKRLAPTK